MQAIAHLAALGVLEKRKHRWHKCWRQFSNPWLCSALEPLPIGLGLPELWDLKSCPSGPHICFRGESRAGKQLPESQANQRQSWGLGPRSPVSSSEPSSASNMLQWQATLGPTRSVLAAEAGPGRAGKAGVATKQAHATWTGFSLRHSSSPFTPSPTARTIKSAPSILGTAVKFFF